jgi:hypothetical protein
LWREEKFSDLPRPFFALLANEKQRDTLLPLYCSEYPVFTCQIGEGVLALAQRLEGGKELGLWAIDNTTSSVVVDKLHHMDAYDRTCHSNVPFFIS